MRRSLTLPRRLRSWNRATSAPTPRGCSYPVFARQQLPIGSGAVESSARHLLQQRVKSVRSRSCDLGAGTILDPSSHLRTGRSLDFLQRLVRPGVIGLERSTSRFKFVPLQRLKIQILANLLLGRTSQGVAPRSSSCGCRCSPGRPMGARCGQVIGDSLQQEGTPARS